MDGFDHVGSSRKPDPWGDATKRALDVSLAAVALIVLAPLLGAIAVVVRATLGSPILFSQRRIGLRERPFTILKFRTMREPRPGEVWFRTNDERVTRLGRFLRTSSLDELPELWNVIRGDMSLVGPRPLLPEYLEEYTPEERRRHHVRPGITGWAAVHGRNVLPFRERLRLDVWYVDHRSFALDLRILMTTVAQVLRRADTVVSEDNAGLGFPLARLASGRASGAAASRSDAAPVSDERQQLHR
jgi:lipopolysaccharide/colanic/teichoic acid biosynthesis glycosyltransferase